MQKKSAVKTFRKIEHGIVAVENIFLVLSLVAMVGSIAIQVVCRYVLMISSPWCEELARYLFVALTFIGAARAFATKEHIGIDLVDTIAEKKCKNPQRVITLFNKLAILITFIFIVLFSYLYFDYLQSIAVHPQVSASMHINMLIPMSSILIGSILMAYHDICRLFYSYQINDEATESA
ncbi:TRAP transporter small permease [Caproicibacter sp.]|uniref:TRAP transporter small permease n=1 Tax=Caproicibacter sp. TaxID=2814884 RepID=UPI00398A084E